MVSLLTEIETKWEVILFKNLERSVAQDLIDYLQVNSLSLPLLKAGLINTTENCLTIGEIMVLYEPAAEKIYIGQHEN